MATHHGEAEETLTKSAREAVNGDGQTLSTQDWIEVAKAMLIREGINAVKIGGLARACGVSRGGFYWRFKSRSELLETLLDDWKRTNTTPILKVLEGDEPPSRRFQKLMRLWIEERDYSPEYDTAVRNWSLSDPKVAALVHEIDGLRIEGLRKLFVDFGYEGDEAFVRARITYYHQAGSSALGERADDPRRRDLSSLYARILTGVPIRPLKDDEEPA